MYQDRYQQHTYTCHSLCAVAGSFPGSCSGAGLQDPVIPVLQTHTLFVSRAQWMLQVMY